MTIGGVIERHLALGSLVDEPAFASKVAPREFVTDGKEGNNGTMGNEQSWPVRAPLLGLVAVRTDERRPQLGR
jgi:hypothetical protein